MALSRLPPIRQWRGGDLPPASEWDFLVLVGDRLRWTKVLPAGLIDMAMSFPYTGGVDGQQPPKPPKIASMTGQKCVPMRMHMPELFDHLWELRDRLLPDGARTLLVLNWETYLSLVRGHPAFGTCPTCLRRGSPLDGGWTLLPLPLYMRGLPRWEYDANHPLLMAKGVPRDHLGSLGSSELPESTGRVSTLATAILSGTKPGGVVLDFHARDGFIARACDIVDRKAVLVDPVVGVTLTSVIAGLHKRGKRVVVYQGLDPQPVTTTGGVAAAVATPVAPWKPRGPRKKRRK